MGLRHKPKNYPPSKRSALRSVTLFYSLCRYTEGVASGCRALLFSFLNHCVVLCFLRNKRDAQSSIIAPLWVLCKGGGEHLFWVWGFACLRIQCDRNLDLCILVSNASDSMCGVLPALLQHLVDLAKEGALVPQLYVIRNVSFVSPPFSTPPPRRPRSANGNSIGCPIFRVFSDYLRSKKYLPCNNPHHFASFLGGFGKMHVFSHGFLSSAPIVLNFDCSHYERRSLHIITMYQPYHSIAKYSHATPQMLAHIF